MSTKKTVKLTSPQKLLIIIFDLSNGTKKTIPYTKIVVESFKKYKKDFHLPGYPKYPDSEKVNKSLYRNSTKLGGLLTYGNKTFTLTNKGLDYVMKLKSAIGENEIYSVEKFDRYIDAEIKRIKNLDSLDHFLKNELDKILDTDFYNYLGVTVRTANNDFIARFNIINEVINLMKKNTNDEFKIILKFNDFMIKKFKNELEFKLNN